MAVRIDHELTQAPSQISPTEMKEVVATLAGGEAVTKVFSEGLHVAGERFVVFKAEGRSIYGRKVSGPLDPYQYPRIPPTNTSYYCNFPPCAFLGICLGDMMLTNIQGKEGIVICKTTQAILVAHYGENVQAGNAAITVEQLADYLVNLNY